MLFEIIIGYLALNSIVKGIGEIACAHEHREIVMQNRMKNLQKRLKYYHEY